MAIAELYINCRSNLRASLTFNFASHEVLTQLKFPQLLFPSKLCHCNNISLKAQSIKHILSCRPNHAKKEVLKYMFDDT